MKRPLRQKFEERKKIALNHQQSPPSNSSHSTIFNNQIITNDNNSITIQDSKLNINQTEYKTFNSNNNDHAGFTLFDANDIVNIQPSSPLPPSNHSISSLKENELSIETIETVHDSTLSIKNIDQNVNSLDLSSYSLSLPADSLMEKKDSDNNVDIPSMKSYQSPIPLISSSDLIFSGMTQTINYLKSKGVYLELDKDFFDNTKANIYLDYYDEEGNPITPKEEYQKISRIFHGTDKKKKIERNKIKDKDKNVNMKDINQNKEKINYLPIIPTPSLVKIPNSTISSIVINKDNSSPNLTLSKREMQKRGKFTFSKQSIESVKSLIFGMK